MASTRSAATGVDDRDGYRAHYNRCRPAALIIYPMGSGVNPSPQSVA